MKLATVIRVDDRFVKRGAQPGGIELVDSPNDAYHWNQRSYALQCAGALKNNYFTGSRVRLEVYVIQDDKSAMKFA